ncbi:hypothetical protein [Mycobacterium sp. SMC-4]|uniref:hypothetical protein n=1 Tax=Mycobacterium sp. SMC-4 TaxID=2857059 RepID=UPI0021B2090F|nr:hypothetical protein [Mycobacterium sp. SMC-4]
MDNSVWIIVAVVVALIVLGLVVFLANKTRHRRRADEADRIRQEVAEDSHRVDRQATLAQEAEAKARAAQAEADAKAAEAARLADTAASRRDTLNSAREHIDSRLSEADKLDPRVGRDAGTGARTGQPGTGSSPTRPDQPDQAGRHTDPGAETMRPDVSNR